MSMEKEFWSSLLRCVLLNVLDICTKQGVSYSVLVTGQAPGCDKSTIFFNVSLGLKIKCRRYLAGKNGRRKPCSVVFTAQSGGVATINSCCVAVDTVQYIRSTIIYKAKWWTFYPSPSINFSGLL